MSNEVRDTESPRPTLDFVPARMINETLYCERLLYLEWSQAEFRDNAFTVEGRYVHRRADEPKGELDSPTPPEAAEPQTPPKRRARSKPEADDAEDSDDAELPYRATSVWLTSDRLGITAKIDVIEGEGKRVTPIEYKRGSRPDLPEGAWLPERAQICAHVLLLREHGFECDSGEIYYAADRQRVPIAIDEPLIEATLAAAARARALLAAKTLPPPLVDSPKCPGCSLVSICLPDETALLRDEPDTVVSPSDPASADDDPAPSTGASANGSSARRLFPARADALPVYVTEHGAYVGKKGDRIEIRSSRGETLADVPALKVSNLSLFANAQVSPAVVRELAGRSIPICHFSSGGWFHALTHGLPSRNVELRVRQFERARDPGRSLEIARRMIAGKIRNQRTLLRRNARGLVHDALRDLRKAAVDALEAATAERLLGIEGNAARIYFQSFALMIDETRRGTTGAFDFRGRNRRPPLDPVNALLSFVYAILVKDLTVTLFAVGFDPHLGFFHTAHHGRPALALDLAEEFRPIIGDSVVLSLINNGEVGPDDFLIRAGSCALTQRGRKALLNAYERRMDALVTHPIFGYSISYRRVLEVQARLLARTVFDEIPRYPTFETR